MQATPQFANRHDNYLTTFAYYDPGHSPPQSLVTPPQMLLDISDKVRSSLLNHLGTKGAHADVGSHVSGVSAHTGNSDASSTSTVNSNNSVHRALRAKNIALQLVSS